MPPLSTFLLDLGLTAVPALVAAASLNHLLYLMNHSRSSQVPVAQRFSDLLAIGITVVVNFFAIVWLTRGTLAVMTGGYSPELREISQAVTVPAAFSLFLLLAFAALPRILGRDKHKPLF